MLNNKELRFKFLFLTLSVSQASFSMSETISEALPIKNSSIQLEKSQAYLKSNELPLQFQLQLGGFVASQSSSTQHINIEGLIGDDFSKNKQNGSNGIVGAGLYRLGYDTQYANFFYGINAFYLPHTGVCGLVAQEDLFTNLAYSYSVTNWPLYLVGKANIKNAHTEKINITLDAGLGANFISTSNFYEQSLDGGVTSPDNIFSGRNKPTFSAMVGIGLKLNNIFSNLPIECGYRFFYLGKGGFNALTNQTTNSLNTGNSYANALMCAVNI